MLSARQRGGCRWPRAAAALCCGFAGRAAAVSPRGPPGPAAGWPAEPGLAAGALAPSAPAVRASLLDVAAAVGISPQQLSLAIIGVVFLLLSACVLAYCVGECILHRRSGGPRRAPAPAAAGAQPAAVGSLVAVEALAAALLDAPDPGPPPAGGGEGGPPPRAPAQATTATANRDRFAQNQSVVARQMLLRALPIFLCTVLLKLTISIAGVVFYITGWVTWFQTRGIPCDQPLQWWLLVALLIPVLHRQTCQDGASGYHKILLVSEIVFVVIGAWLLFSCGTCSETNSSLYNFVGYYLIYKVLARSLQCLTSCGLMTLMFFIARRGLLDSSQSGMAARPGFVEEIETVEFSPDLFAADGQDDYKQPPECCICQESFGRDKVIKKTVCGHFFHKECLGEWLEKYSRTCPLCRRELEEVDGKPPAGAAGDLR